MSAWKAGEDALELRLAHGRVDDEDIEDEEADEDVEDQERIDEDLLKDQGKFRSGAAGVAVIFLFHSFSYVFHDLPSFLNRYCP